MSTREGNYNARSFGKKSTPLWGIFNNYKEKLSVPRVPRVQHGLSPSGNIINMHKISKIASVKADFLSWQKILATIFFQKNSVK